MQGADLFLVWRAAHPARLGRQLAHEAIGEQVAFDPLDNQALHPLAGDTAAFSNAIAPIPIAHPFAAVRGAQQPGQQVFRARPVAGRPAGLQAGQNRLCLLGRDQALVGVVIHHPFRARPALHAALVAAAVDPLGVNVPDRVPGIGEGVPLDADQARRADAGQPGLGYRCCPADASRPGLEIVPHLVGALAAHQAGFCHRLPVADRACLDVLEAVTKRCPAAGAPALAHVFGHPAEALFLRHQTVQHVEGAHHLLDHHVHDGVRLGQLRIEHLDPAFFAFVVEHGGQVLVLPRDAGSV
ncbi:MAG: hypothetical protein ROZ00_04820 [Denitratisoma sp.]|nr:hypothetical protein [Denitratisoma sp.]